MDMEVDSGSRATGAGRRGNPGGRRSNSSSHFNGNTNGGSYNNGGGTRPHSAHNTSGGGRGGDPAGAWSHDLYDEAPPAAAAAAARNGGAATSEQLVRISNLHWSVTEEDLEELFGFSEGLLKSARIKYDSAGRSEGAADLLFATREAAENAVMEYNGRELDQMPMLLKLVVPMVDRLGPQPVEAPRAPAPVQRGGHRSVMAAAAASASGSRAAPASAATRSGVSGSSLSSAAPPTARGGMSGTTNSSRVKKSRPQDVLARLGKRVEERLGKRLEDRLGSRTLSGATTQHGVGSLNRSPGLSRRQRGGSRIGGNRTRNGSRPVPTRAELDAGLDAITKAGRGTQRPIVSYADADHPADVNMI